MEMEKEEKRMKRSGKGDWIAVIMHEKRGGRAEREIKKAKSN